MGLLERIRRVVGAERNSHRYRCAECGEAVAYAPSVEEPTCPYCDSAKLLTVEAA